MKRNESSLIAVLLAIALSTVIIVTSFVSPAYANIFFHENWNAPENNDVGKFTTQEQVTNFLKQKSPMLEQAIDNTKCYVRVSKGCHQRNDPHITTDAIVPTGKQYQKYNDCKVSGWVGTKSNHIPCS